MKNVVGVNNSLKTPSKQVKIINTLWPICHMDKHQNTHDGVPVFVKFQVV